MAKFWTDEECERKNKNVAFKKGTRVKVVCEPKKMIEEMKRELARCCRSRNPVNREKAKSIQTELDTITAAVGGIFVIVGYYYAYNPHVIEVNGRRIGLPKECLEAVE